MRQKVVPAAIVAVLIVAAALVWLRRPASPSAPAPAPQAKPAAAAAPPKGAVPSQQQLETDLIVNGVTPERAKLLFSVAIGPLPGVDIPAGFARDPTDFDGTPAITALYQVWNSLTPDQRRAAGHLLQRPVSTSERRDDGPAVRLAAFHTSEPSAPAAYDYKSMLQDADGALASFLKVDGVKYVYDVDYEPYTGIEYAHTSYWAWSDVEYVPHPAYPDGGCHLVIRNSKFLPITEDDARAVLTHEMFHCYQQRLANSFDEWASVPWWIREGEPTWAMAAVVPGARSVLEVKWNTYASTPQKEYFNRGYDGIGIFGHMSDVAGDTIVWGRLLPMFEHAIGGDSPAAFAELIQGYEDDYYSTWGSSYFITHGHREWTMTGPAHPPDSGITPPSISVADGETKTIAFLGPYQAQITTVSTSADILIVGLFNGYGRAHDEAFGIDTALDSSGTLALCVKPGGCTCPDGTPGASLGTKRATQPVSIGIEAGGDFGVSGATAQSLDGFCKKPDDPPAPPPPIPGPGGAAGDGGGTPPEKPPGPTGWYHDDTHGVTLDGLKYDFQVVGEYTLVRSTKDDFTIQIRQVPVLQSRAVSVIHAVATRIGATRLTITIENDAPVLRLDGRVVDAAAPRLAAGSLTRASTMFGTTFELRWPDGTAAQVAQMGRRVLNVLVKPAEVRRGMLAGLLGDFDGSPDNDLVGPGGARIAVPPSPNDLTHGLADAWRVAPGASLFDYAPGESAATFNDPTFPEFNVDPSRVPDRDSAEKNCRLAGLTDPTLLQNCIVDFGLTSDFLFARTYSHDQQLLAARAAIPRAPSPGVLRTIVLEGTITDPAAKPSIEFQGNAGDIVWIGNPGCVDSYRLELGLVGPDGKGLSGGAACATGRRILPATGMYALRGYRTNNPTGAFHVPIRFIRRDRKHEVAYGDVVAGRIETRAVHDVYTFAGHAGDVLRIAGEGCNMGSLTLSLIDADRHESLGPSCRVGSDVRLTKTGPYQIVVNGSDVGPDVYRFVLQGASSR